MRTARLQGFTSLSVTDNRVEAKTVSDHFVFVLIGLRLLESLQLQSTHEAKCGPNGFV